MSKNQLKAFIFHLVFFIVLFTPIKYFLVPYVSKNIFASIIAFIIATIITPKFHAIKTSEGEKLFVRWIFINGIREIGK